MKTYQRQIYYSKHITVCKCGKRNLSLAEKNSKFSTNASYLFVFSIHLVKIVVLRLALIIAYFVITTKFSGNRYNCSFHVALTFGNVIWSILQRNIQRLYISLKDLYQGLPHSNQLFSLDEVLIS